MDPITRMVAAGAAGVSGSSATYVDDLFSTNLYDSNASSNFDGTEQVITTGIDHTEGFLTWIRNRDDATDHVLFDSERIGTNYKWIYSNDDKAEQDTADIFKNPTSTGFTVKQATSGSGTGRTNPSGSKKMVSWTFRKAPGFFDIQTWTGNGADSRDIAHNLGSTPGMIIVKCTSTTYHWSVFHRDNGHPAFNNGGGAYGLFLNRDVAGDPSAAYWWNTAPTSTHFTAGIANNLDTETYVAYIFAHDDARFGKNEDESVVKCGTYSGSSSEVEVNLGFEPQWLLIKSDTTASAWNIVDHMRGLGDSDTPRLRPNLDNAEQTTSPAAVKLTPTGFIATTANSEYNQSGQDFIYMAIRRPNKPPTAATDVFAIDTAKATSPSPPQFTSGFVTDFAIRTFMSSGGLLTGSRLQGLYTLNPGHTTVEDRVWPATSLTWDFMDGWSKHDSDPADPNLFAYMFKRAPGFFDVVTYKGSSSAQNISHNLTVKPELMLFKNRERAFNWDVYSSVTGLTKYMQLNVAYGESGPAPQWNSTEPTATQFSVGSNAGTVNYNGDDHIAFLFASLSGISKVGSYTGTGNDINVNCGFSAGARFIMIHRTDPTTANWYVWDTTNGIVSGDDPYWVFANPAAAVTNTDYIDPLNAGFTVTSNAPADLNAVGGTYLFLAIA